MQHRQKGKIQRNVHNKGRRSQHPTQGDLNTGAEVVPSTFFTVPSRLFALSLLIWRLIFLLSYTIPFHPKVDLKVWYPSQLGIYTIVGGSHLQLDPRSKPGSLSLHRPAPFTLFFNTLQTSWSDLLLHLVCLLLFRIYCNLKGTRP